jgi:glycosyltransferase involved in cell wall biosynthesis
MLAARPSVSVFHDLQHKRHPEHFRWFDLPFWRLLLWASAHCSQRLIAVSEAMRADLLHYYRLPPKRITVIPHGVEPRIFARRKRDFRLRAYRDSRLSYPLAGDIDHGAECGVPDVGCALAECAETGGGTAAGQLSGSRMAAVLRWWETFLPSAAMYWRPWAACMPTTRLRKNGR